jgi:hypothetical protein
MTHPIIRPNRTLAVLFVEYLKEALATCNYSFPVSVNWTHTPVDHTRPLEEYMSCTLDGPDRHDPATHREGVRRMAELEAEGLTDEFDSREFTFNFAADWFQVVEDATTVTLRIVRTEEGSNDE